MGADRRMSLHWTDILSTVLIECWTLDTARPPAQPPSDLAPCPIIIRLSYTPYFGTICILAASYEVKVGHGRYLNLPTRGNMAMKSIRPGNSCVLNPHDWGVVCIRQSRSDFLLEFHSAVLDSLIQMGQDGRILSQYLYQASIEVT